MPVHKISWIFYHPIKGQEFFCPLLHLTSSQLHFAETIFRAGKVNRVVGFIDCTSGMTDEEINLLAYPQVLDSPWYNSKYPSKMAFDEAVVPTLEDFTEIEDLLKRHIFLADKPDLVKIRENTSSHGFDFFVFGSEADPLAHEAVRREELIVQNSDLRESSIIIPRDTTASRSRSRSSLKIYWIRERLKPEI